MRTSTILSLSIEVIQTVSSFVLPRIQITKSGFKRFDDG